MNAFKSLFMSLIFPLVPKRLLSRITGVIMRFPLGPLAPSLIPRFAKFFKINMDEAEFEPGHYKSFDDYFVRRLKPGLRPIQGELVHPCDGRLTENGPIEDGQLVQAKGWGYRLAEFLGSSGLAKTYTESEGSFATYYLCPADYHRVHAPCDGELVSCKHIPGLLWPVNEWSVNKVKRLFNLNERVVMNFNSPAGRWSLVMVAATNVGNMTMNFDDTIVTKQWFWKRANEHHYSPPIRIKAGQELGAFHLGSTVVVIFERQKPPMAAQSVKLGQPFR